MDKVKPTVTSDNMYADSGSNPARDAVAVTPSDATVYTPRFRFLTVGTGGNVTIVTARGNTVTIPNVQDGGFVWDEASKVMATGTTATGIVGHFG